MALMITLDDAMKVLIYGSYLDDGYKDDDGFECVRNELEQKCYSILKPKNSTWFDEIRRDIEYITRPEEIGKHIVEGDLKNWLEICRDNIIGELTEMAKKNMEE